jgi:hypothetical protein
VRHSSRQREPAWTPMRVQQPQKDLDRLSQHRSSASGDLAGIARQTLQRSLTRRRALLRFRRCSPLRSPDVIRIRASRIGVICTAQDIRLPVVHSPGRSRAAR